MWHYFNNNPEGFFVGDCTVRAICAVTGLSWYIVHLAQSVLSSVMSDMPSSDRVWWKLLTMFGYDRVRLIDQCPDCYTVADFAHDHPKGKYVLGPMEHAVAVIDGDWYDTWDSGNTVPLYYFGKSNV